MAAPRPKSPLDPCGRHRLQLAVDALHRQISFLEGEINSIEGLHAASICCKENPVGVFELLPVDLRRWVLRRPAQGAELLLRMPPAQSQAQLVFLTGMIMSYFWLSWRCGFAFYLPRRWITCAFVLAIVSYVLIKALEITAE
ncbi:hypothetical protein TRIUR3_07930 [Triticum urartu]|uniref:Uncharacterized protein n=1 Tax=Triticum urartu TaxID=4572 RepID=M8AST2_TRIUA|nr:hypothetical protein TRIUR3_07930 [Triticum urartu]